MSESEKARENLPDITEKELVALPNELVFLLRDLNDWLRWESSQEAQRFASQIDALIERHYTVLMLANAGVPLDEHTEAAAEPEPPSDSSPRSA